MGGGRGEGGGEGIVSVYELSPRGCCHLPIFLHHWGFPCLKMRYRFFHGIGVSIRTGVLALRNGFALVLPQHRPMRRKEGAG